MKQRRAAWAFAGLLALPAPVLLIAWGFTAMVVYAGALIVSAWLALVIVLMYYVFEPDC